MTSAELKAAARGFGADLVGIASVDALRGLPPEENPLSIFPQAKVVIVLGRKVLRGALRGVEEGSEFSNAFPTFGFYGHEDIFLSKTTYDVNLWIEARGHDGVPLFAYDSKSRAEGVPVAPGKPAPNVLVNYRVMAQAAGLGETGLHGLFLTPEFGVRQRFAMVLTDADIEPDKPFVPRICNDCGACVAECPLGALDASKTSAFGSPGCERAVASRDNALCLRCKNGAVQTNEGRFNAVERMAASCSRACIAALEERGATSEKFNGKFRPSAPSWTVDRLGTRTDSKGGGAK
ncbi:MAG: hypothetical protein ACOX9C_02910 [Kiritimatiellia bacterium]|jgi:epoxyqueuosine reductase